MLIRDHPRKSAVRFDFFNPRSPAFADFSRHLEWLRNNRAPSLRSGLQKNLLQCFRLYSYVLFARRFLLPVLAHPGFKALSCGGIATAEGQRYDL